MLFIFGTILIVASIILGVIILIQNPKGGGLNSSLSGIGNSLMGVKQTNNILEKGTWVFAAIIGFLCLTSALFIPKTSGTNSKEQLFKEAPVGTPMAPKTNPAQLPPAGMTPQQNTPPPPPPAN